MAIKLQVRRDTLANWTANQTVVLLSGEIGYVTDTRNMKIGDGTTTWENLKYQAPYYTGENSGAPNTLLSLDITNSRVGIGTTTPAKALGVVGDIYVGNQTNSGTDGTLGLISSGGANYIQSGQNIDASSAPLIIGAIGGGTNWLRVTSGGVGIGVTASPSNTLNIESATPTIRLKDTTAAGNTAHCLIDANGDDGSIVIAADPTAAGAAASTVSLSVDNTTRLQATTTGVAITGTTTSSGLLTATDGFTVSGGSVSIPNSSIGGVALSNNSVILAKLAQQSTPVLLGTPSGTSTATNISALTQAQAQTMLGLPTRSLGSVSVTGTQANQLPNSATANLAIGEWAQFYFGDFNGGANSMGRANQTWFYFVNRVSGGNGSQLAITIQTGVVTGADIATATGLSASSDYNYCVCRIA